MVNVGRAGAANLDVIQEVEYVKQEAKIVYLLECLQKTSPPVLIFCEKKQDVDDIHEYLLLKVRARVEEQIFCNDLYLSSATFSSCTLMFPALFYASANVQIINVHTN